MKAFTERSCSAHDSAVGSLRCQLVVEPDCVGVPISVPSPKKLSLSLCRLMQKSAQSASVVLLPVCLSVCHRDASSTAQPAGLSAL